MGNVPNWSKTKSARLRRPRAVTAVFIGMLAFGAAAVAHPHLQDVPPDHPNSAAVENAVRRGWFQGYPDGTFQPDRPITADQLAKVVGRVLPDGTTRSVAAAFLVAGERALHSEDDLADEPPVKGERLIPPPDYPVIEIYNGTAPNIRPYCHTPDGRNDLRDVENRRANCERGAIEWHARIVYIPDQMTWTGDGYYLYYQDSEGTTRRAAFGWRYGIRPPIVLTADITPLYVADWGRNNRLDVMVECIRYSVYTEFATDDRSAIPRNDCGVSDLDGGEG